MIVSGQRLPSGGTESLYREEFGYDAATSASPQYCSFGSSVVERNETSQNPRAANLWRAPFDGTITAIYLVHETDAAGANFELRELDGTVVGSANASTTSISVDGPTGTDTLYRTSVEPDFDVVEGELYTLVIDPTATIGEVGGWLEVSR